MHVTLHPQLIRRFEKRGRGRTEAHKLELISAGEALGMDFPGDLVRLLAVTALEWKIKDEDEFDLEWISLIEEGFPLTDASNWPLVIDARTQALITLLSASSSEAIRSKRFDGFCTIFFCPGSSEFEPDLEHWKEILAARKEALRCCREDATRNYVDLVASIASKFSKEKHRRGVEGAIECAKKGLSVHLSLANHRSVLQQAGFTLEAVSDLEHKAKISRVEKSETMEKILKIGGKSKAIKVADMEQLRLDHSFSFRRPSTNEQIESLQQTEGNANQGFPPGDDVTTPRNPPQKASGSGAQGSDHGDPFQTPIASRRTSSQSNPITPVCQQSPGILTVLTPGPGKAKRQQTDGQEHRNHNKVEQQSIKGGKPGRSEQEIGNGLQQEEPWDPSACAGPAEKSSKKLVPASETHRKPDARGGQSSGMGLSRSFGADQQMGRKHSGLATVQEEPSPGRTETDVPRRKVTFGGGLPENREIRPTPQEEAAQEPCLLGRRDGSLLSLLVGKNKRRDVDGGGVQDHGKRPIQFSTHERNDGRQGLLSSNNQKQKNQSRNFLDGRKGICRNSAKSLDDSKEAPPKMMPAEEVIKKYIKMALANPGKEVAFPTLVPPEMREGALRAERVFKAALQRIEEARKNQETKKQQEQRPDRGNQSNQNTTKVSKGGPSGGEKRKARGGQDFRRGQGSNRGGAVTRWNPSGVVKHTPRGGLRGNTGNMRQSRIPQRPLQGRGVGGGGGVEGNVSDWNRVKANLKDSREERNVATDGPSSKHQELPESVDLSLDDISGDFGELQRPQIPFRIFERANQGKKDTANNSLEVPPENSEIESLSRGINRKRSIPASFFDGNEGPNKKRNPFLMDNRVQGCATADRNQTADIPPTFGNPAPGGAFHQPSSKAPQFPVAGNERRMDFSGDQAQRRGSTPMTDLAKLKEMARKHRKEGS